MMKNLGFFLIVLITLANISHAKPVLVAVELNTKDEIKAWHSMNYPTYEFIKNNAIAEIDDRQLQSLNAKGFAYQVIDQRPWDERYYIIETTQDIQRYLSTTIIWQKDNTFLLKVSKEKFSDLLNLRTRFTPLKKRLLPARFWNQIMVDIVPIAVSWDPFIQNIVDQVSTDSIMAYVQRLQDFKTRLVLTDSSYAASRWLGQKFSSWGYSVEFDSFYIDTAMAAWGYWPDTGYERNVIATYTGSVNPSKIFIVGGHFDAVVWNDTAVARINAPGADDNASGTVAALEAARIFRNYTWDPVIKFVGWGVEELGLYGSEHYSQWADSQNLDIGGVVNADMIAYMDDAYLDCIIQRRSCAQTWLSDLFCQAGQLYAPTLIIDPVIGSGGSDWYPFANLGYPSVGSMENSGSFFNPNYHDTTDLVSTLSPTLFTEITKATVATMAILSSCPGVVPDVVTHDLGDGNRLVVNWSQNPEPDVIGYNVYWGRQSGIYSDTHFVSGIGNTTDTLTGLTEDSTYYIAVTAWDNDNHESYAAIEITATPRNIPLAPQGVIATPLISGIRVDWTANNELDLAGYRVYRRLNENPQYDSLNNLLLTDTTFTNAPLSGENKYYYTIRAFDADGNAGPMSDEAYGRPITLDQGILIVDETKNWTSGNFPTDSAQDSFYDYIMSGYNFTSYEYGTEAESPVLADLVPYSTVLWHADDNIEFMASGNVPDFENYLAAGGRLWFVGWKPTGDLRNSSSYPAIFSAGDFIYDYLKVAQATLSSTTDSFIGANGLLGYPGIAVIPDKVPLPSWGGTMRYIEAYTAVSPAENIYTIDMRNNTSPFEGLVCAVRYLDSDFKTCFFGFPLYFMDQDEARAVAQKVMGDFGELGIAEQMDNGSTISEFKLMRNMSNPIKGTLKINFISPDEREVVINLYDVMGRLTARIFDAKAQIGMNEVSLMQSNLPTGIYFIQISAPGYKETAKIILLK